MSGAGNGGGIRAFAVNGDDLRDSLINSDSSWYRLNIFNNIIVNNIAGLSGAGISLQDVARANIVNNTIANNDSTATSSAAFEIGAANSTPQPSGLASNIHSSILQDLLDVFTLPETEPTYSDPVLLNNIIRQNRSFFNDASLNGGAGGLAINPAGLYWDLHVVGSLSDTDPHLNPDYCLLESLSNPATGFSYADGTNLTNNPFFLGAYFNQIESVTVVDEGGNAINLRFIPLLTAGSDYHIGTGGAWDTGSNALVGTFPELSFDFDGESRPYDPGTGGTSDIGADEIQAAAAVASLSLTLGNKGTAADIDSMGPQTNMQFGSGSGSSASMPAAGLITGQSGTMMDRVKEKLAGTLDKLVPGQRKSTSSGIDSKRSKIPLDSTGNASELSSGENQTLAMGLTLGNNKNRSAQENSSAKTFMNPVLGEMSKSGDEMKRDVSMAKTDQSSAAGVAGVKQQQGESNSTMFKYSLLGLLLASLAFVLFMVFMPKTKNRREQ